MSLGPSRMERQCAGHNGMETCVANLLEPGEKVVVGNNGIWGSRVVDMAGRYNGEQCVQTVVVMPAIT